MSKVLYVHAKGGAPVRYALTRVAARCTVHLLALSELPDGVADDAATLCASVGTVPDTDGHDLVELITSRAREVGA
ncbi:ATP-grasp domain-containing protein, partial [Streptomyces sp. NPDC058964]